MSNADKWLCDLECVDRESLSWNKILALIYDVKQPPPELCKAFKRLVLFGDTALCGVRVHLGQNMADLSLLHSWWFIASCHSFPVGSPLKVQEMKKVTKTWWTMKRWMESSNRVEARNDYSWVKKYRPSLLKHFPSSPSLGLLVHFPVSVSLRIPDRRQTNLRRFTLGTASPVT